MRGLRARVTCEGYVRGLRARVTCECHPRPDVDSPVSSFYMSYNGLEHPCG